MQFFQYRFSFGNLRAMAMEPVGHIAGLPQRLLALFLLSWPFLSAFLLAVLLQIGVAIICWFRYVQHYQSDYLFI
jgi:uncharacterized membrane protein